MRINEPFGDAVNWDLIPSNAIDQAAIVTNNPAFGLNALGGALSLRMKNGFTFKGFETDIRLGSFGRKQAGKRPPAAPAPGNRCSSATWPARD